MRAILRVDDRLLHGKLSISWTSYLKTDTILIANENAVNDEFTMMSLRLAKPRNVQIIIQDIPDAIAYLRESSESERRILVVVKKLSMPCRCSKRFPFSHHSISAVCVPAMPRLKFHRLFF